MASKFYNLKGADIAELTDIIKDSIYHQIREELIEYLCNALNEIKESVVVESSSEESSISTDALSHIFELIENKLNNNIAKMDVNINNSINKATQSLVDELGLRGWEILNPSVVKKVKHAGITNRKNNVKNIRRSD